MQTPVEDTAKPKIAEIGTRRHARSLFSVPFQVHQLDIQGLHPIRAISLDISEGGLGALVQGQLRVGEAVRIDLPLGQRTVRALAVVRYTSGVRSGFEFLRLSPMERQQITSPVGTA